MLPCSLLFLNTDIKNIKNVAEQYVIQTGMARMAMLALRNMYCGSYRHKLLNEVVATPILAISEPYVQASLWIFLGFGCFLCKKKLVIHPQ